MHNLNHNMKFAKYMFVGGFISKNDKSAYRDAMTNQLVKVNNVSLNVDKTKEMTEWSLHGLLKSTVFSMRRTSPGLNI